MTDTRALEELPVGPVSVQPVPFEPVLVDTVLVDTVLVEPVPVDTVLVEPVRVEPMEADRRRPASGAAMTVLAVLAAIGAALGVWLLVFGGDAVDNDILLIDEEGTVSLLDVETGRTVFEVPNAVVAPDRSTLLTTESTVSGTVIETRDPATGEPTGTTTVLGDQQIRAVSPRGDAIALMAPRAPDLGLYEPEPRTSSEVTVAFTDERPAVRYELDGNFEPEVFSVGAETLYLLEFVPPTNPDHYLVRELDVDSGLVGAVKSPQVDIEPEMRGVARGQAVSPDGSSSYTLYSQPPGADPIHDLTDPVDTDRWAFVHVLDLEQGFDFCIFLPVPMGTVNEANLGIGLSPDGRTLYVVDPSHALVARIDTESLEITALHEVPEILNWTERPEVAVADDGTLFVGLGPDVLEFWPGITEETGPFLSAGGGFSFTAPASGLSLTSDNRYLRLAADGQVIIIDRYEGVETAVLTAPTAGGSYDILGPPSGDVTRIPFSCAC